MHIPVVGYHSLLHLLPLPLLERRPNHVLHVPRALVLHQILLAPLEHFVAQRGNVRFISELGDGREERFEVEDDRCADGEAAEGLPVNAQMASFEAESRRLGQTVRLVGVAGRHEKRRVHLETPRSTLDWARRRELGKVSATKLESVWKKSTIDGGRLCRPVHRKLHLLFVVWDGGVYLLKLETELRTDSPA